MQIRKNRGGRQWLQYPFKLHEVTAPEPDAEGEPVTTAIVHWGETVSGDGAAQALFDRWATSRQLSQRVTAQRLERALTEVLAEHGSERPIPPDGALVSMVDQERVRELFYSRTVVDEGTPKEQRQARFRQFRGALNWAEKEGLIGIGEIC